MPPFKKAAPIIIENVRYVLPDNHEKKLLAMYFFVIGASCHAIVLCSQGDRLLRISCYDKAKLPARQVAL